MAKKTKKKTPKKTKRPKKTRSIGSLKKKKAK